MPSIEGALQNRKENLLNQTAVIIITYNHKDYIEECLESVFDNDPGEVVVVDNGSTDGTVATVKSKFPETNVIQTEGNPGYGSASNRGVQQVDSEYVVVLNPDTRVDTNLVHKLVRPLADNERLITVPKILTYKGDVINTIGNTIHFSGLAFTLGYGEPPGAYSETIELAGISGACFATTRQTYHEMNGFEESIFMYMEDTELSWKANALKIDIHYVPTAIVYHDYPGVEVNAAKLLHLESGRYIILRKYLDLKTFALILPSLFMTEVLTWGYAVSQGLAGVKAKLRAIANGFSADIETAKGDSRALLCQLDTRIPPDQIHSSRVVEAGIQVVNKLFEFNHSLLKR